MEYEIDSDELIVYCPECNEIDPSGSLLAHSYGDNTMISSVHWLDCTECGHGWIASEELNDLIWREIEKTL